MTTMTTVTTQNPIDLSTELAADDRSAIAERLAHEHTADIAALAEEMLAEDAARVLLSLPEPRQADLFGYLSHDLQSRLAHVLERAEMARILGAMAHDERADLVEHLTEAQRAALLPGIAQAEREDVRRLAAYPDGTVGSVMTSDYATIPPDLTTVQAVGHLRLVAPDAETIYHSYVLDTDRRLVGTVSLRDLIVARDDFTVEQVMRRKPPFVLASDDREVAVMMIRRYDLLALPVLDHDGRLAGIVTYDDAMDTAHEAET